MSGYRHFPCDLISVDIRIMPQPRKGSRFMQTKTEVQLNQGWDYHRYCRAALQRNTLSPKEARNGQTTIPCKQQCDHNQTEGKELGENIQHRRTGNNTTENNGLVTHPTRDSCLNNPHTPLFGHLMEKFNSICSACHRWGDFSPSLPLCFSPSIHY